MSGENLLQITIRCMTEDFQGDVDSCTAPQGLDHVLAQAFAVKRAQLPVGQETVTDLSTNKPIFTLHGGRWRGATWHDEDESVVWLLAARLHSSGAPDDSYPYFRELDAIGKLLPTRDDRELLHKVKAANVFEWLGVEIDALASEARQSPNTEIRGTIAGTFSVSVLYEREGDAAALWVVVSYRIDETGGHPPADWMQMLLARFFPGATYLDLINSGTYPLRGLGTDEVAFCQVELPNY